MKNIPFQILGIVMILFVALSSCRTTEEGVEEDVVTAVPTVPNNQAAAQQQQISNQQVQQSNVYQRGGQIGGNDMTGRPDYDTIQPPVPPPARNRIQVALLLDTSNSMDGLIDQAKSQLWKMVNELAKASKEDGDPQIELSLYEYGNDWLDGKTGFIRKVGRLTIDLEWTSEQLFLLKTNGGEEYCAWVIDDGLDHLDWSNNPNDLKIIFIAGNEPFNQGPVDYKKVCQKAKEKGVIINTIHCGGYDEGIKDMWGDGASCSGGKYMNINQDEKVVHIPTPYDDKVLELNKKLNDTYIGYGRKGASYKEKQVANDVSSAEYSSANTRTRTFYKTKSNYKNTSWDLVDATDKDYDGFMKTVKNDELPEEMQKMSADEKKVYIEKKRTERKSLQAELKELETKVDKFIVDKKKEMAAGEEVNTLDNVMMSAIRKQAKDKGFVFK
ncbi:MAG: hypothetical protein ACI94Y_004271 [Maribacter sp.]|jgi:hypothetical protein